MSNELPVYEKYNLPSSVKVEVKENPEGGFYAKLPDYPGCMTEADDELELVENITDAILTYFEVPREEAIKSKIIYFPTPKIGREVSKRSLAGLLHLNILINPQYVGYPSFR